MSAIDNLNTKPVKQIISEVTERFRDDSTWGRTNLADRYGCMCLLGAVSVAEGIVTADDYADLHRRDCDPENVKYNVGEFENQAALYEALNKSETVIALAQAIANANPFLAQLYNNGGASASTIVYVFNDGKDQGFITNENLHDRHELSYGRVMKLLNSLNK